MVLKRKNGTKTEILQQHSALNCRPDDVRDELFLEYEFFDAFDTVQIKYEMLRRVQKDGWPVSRAAKVFGFSRNAFYKARIAFQKAGIAGLFRERPGPRHAHKLSEEVMDFIKQALKENSELSTLDLRQMIKDKFGISVHRRSIERTLQRHEKKG
jgi:transposase